MANMVPMHGKYLPVLCTAEHVLLDMYLPVLCTAKHVLHTCTVQRVLPLFVLTSVGQHGARAWEVPPRQ